MSNLSAFAVGLIFAIGLGVAGMTDANKILDFLNVAGDWDPSLLVVIASALSVHFFLYRVILKRKAPLFEKRFLIPTRRDIDTRLIVGSAIFGVGWGLSGLCPGPAITSLLSLGMPVAIFTATMLIGMLIFQLQRRRVASVATVKTSSVSSEEPC